MIHLLRLTAILGVMAVSGCDKSTEPETRNQNPIAAFTNSEPTRPNKAITFDGSTSKDPDGSIVGYKWDFGDKTFSDELRPSKIFTSVGSYRVTLTVYDNLGLSATSSRDIVVEANKLPIAGFTYTTPTIINRTVYFDASASKDSDGSIARVKWYFYQSQATSTELKPSKKFTQPGYTKVRLTVYDNEGDSTILTKDIYIELTGSTADCETFGGHYKYLPYRWKPTTEATQVIMTFSSFFKAYDPGWQSISTNTGIYAMAEWHWYSGADIDFRYYTTLKDYLCPKNDGYNAITFFAIDGEGGALAQARIWYYTSSGYASEVDVVVDWSETWGITGSAGAHDLQSVLTHEFGHVWMLGDLYDPIDKWETMYGYSGSGEIQARTLYCGDKRGMRNLYGQKPSSPSIFSNDDDMKDRLEPYPETITVSSAQ